MSASYDAVIQSNIDLHRLEAPYYDVIHYEVWNRKEQARLKRMLKHVLKLLPVQHNVSALDFGAGTGVVTEKLLDLGCAVMAVDISKEMCRVLKTKFAKFVKEGKLVVLNVNIDKTCLTWKFDLVTCYNVLHHLPDYNYTLTKLADCLKQSGVLYIDCEPVETGKNPLPTRIIGFIAYCLAKVVQALFLKNIPRLDYSHADVHDYLDTRAILNQLAKQNFQTFTRTFATCPSQFITPFSLIFRYLRKPNKITIIAIKNPFFMES